MRLRERPRDVEAALAAEADVEQDEIRPAARDDLVGCRGAVRLPHHIVAAQREQLARAAPEAGMVIDDRDADGSGHRPSVWALWARCPIPRLRYSALSSACPSARSRPAASAVEIARAAMISVRWLNACGKLPTWRRRPTSYSSASRPTSLARPARRSNSPRA